ncbi:MAG: hypothetical protein ABI838_05495 [Chloroflexota bacterium]
MKLGGLASAVLLAAIAGGQAPAGPRPAAADRVYVVGSGPKVVGLDAQTGAVAVQLPLAVARPDWKLAYAVTGDRLQYLDPATGAEVFGIRLPGPYQLPQTTADRKPGGLSQDGRWLVLYLTASNHNKASFLVVDTQARVIAHRADLEGWWEFDGIDDHGLRLYLTHYLPDNPGRYNVSLYHVDTQAIEGPIVEKSGDLRVMEGTRLSAVTDPSGQWQYSLYSRSGQGAFIHTLSLNAPFAWCVDLPGAGTPEQQSAWSLAMSSDGRRLFATNPVLKRALAYDLQAASPGSPPQMQRSTVWSRPATATIPGGSVLAADLGRLFVVVDHGLLVVDPQGLDVRNQWARTQTFQTLAAASDGNRLYAFAGAQLVRVDARTGAVESGLPLAMEPVAILGVRAM